MSLSRFIGETTLFIKNLNKRISREQMEPILWELFIQAGPLDKLVLIGPNSSTVCPSHTGMAFVNYSHTCSVAYAYMLLGREELFGYKLELDKKCPSELENILNPKLNDSTQKSNDTYNFLRPSERIHHTSTSSIEATSDYFYDYERVARGKYLISPLTPPSYRPHFNMPSRSPSIDIYRRNVSYDNVPYDAMLHPINYSPTSPYRNFRPNFEGTYVLYDTNHPSNDNLYSPIKNRPLSNSFPRNFPHDSGLPPLPLIPPPLPPPPPPPLSPELRPAKIFRSADPLPIPHEQRSVKTFRNTGQTSINDNNSSNKFVYSIPPVNTLSPHRSRFKYNKVYVNPEKFEITSNNRKQDRKFIRNSH